MKIVNKRQLRKKLKEYKKDPEKEEDLCRKYSELNEMAVDKFNNMLKEKGVNTNLYALKYSNFSNKNIFGDPYLNCTVHGILNKNCNVTLLVKLLEIAEKIRNAINKEDFKLFKIEEVGNSWDKGITDKGITFKLIFEDGSFHCYHSFFITLIDYYSMKNFDLDKDVVIWDSSELTVDARNIFAIDDSEAKFGDMNKISINFTYFSSDFNGEKVNIDRIGVVNYNGRKLYCNNDKSYERVAEIARLNVNRLSDNLRLVANKVEGQKRG